MMGVEYDLFWELDPKSLSPFVKAFSLKTRYDDTMAWQQGIYIRMAIASCLDKNVKYPKKPMIAEKVTKTKSVDNEQIKFNFLNHAQLLNKKFKV